MSRRLSPAQTTCFSFPKSGDLLDHTSAESFLGGQRGVMLIKARLLRCLFGKIHLGQEMLIHIWEEPEIYQIWTVNQAYQNDWPKETWKKYPIKIIQTAIRMLLSNSLLEPACVSIHTYCILFFLLINTLLASLISIFVEILFCKAKGPGPLSLTTGLVPRICYFHCYDSAQSLAGSPSLAPRHCRLRAPKSRLIASHSESFFQELGQSVWRLPSGSGSKTLDYTSSDLLSV